jgi:outer membrane immunogenic protein
VAADNRVRHGANFMKKLFAACIAAAAFSGAPALAAPPGAIPSWTGGYLGINGGGAWGNAGEGFGIVNNTFAPLPTGQLQQSGTNTINTRGGLAGGQIGYLLQSGSVVAGVEASFDWFGTRGSVSNGAVFTGFAPAAFSFSDSVRTDWLAVFAARVGFTSGGWFPYVTAGVAVADQKYTSIFNDNQVGFPAVANVSMSKVGVAPAFGAGLEYKLDDHWSIRGEWLYTAFPGFNANAPLINPLTGVQYGPGETFAHSVAFSTINIGRFALSYKF